MAKRKIIRIDEEKCNGCGKCVQGCHEGALQLIDGKARIVSELYCDGLGACIGDCPVEAITVEEREAEPYNEEAVMERIVPKGHDTVIAHLRHLKEHGEMLYLQQGVQYLKSHGIAFDPAEVFGAAKACGCPGSAERTFEPTGTSTCDCGSGTEVRSELTHWPIQLHLLNPTSACYHNADVLLAADCTAFSLGGFHAKYLRNRKLAIACPKLDSDKDSYIDKITRMIDQARINTLTVLIMEVPCCSGLLMLAKTAAGNATRKIPIRKVTVGLQGNILEDIWI